MASFRTVVLVFLFTIVQCWKAITHLASIVQAILVPLICRGFSTIWSSTSSIDEATRNSGQVPMRQGHYSTDMSQLAGSDIVAGHRWGKGNSHTSVLMKAGVHDWTSTRRKSSPSLSTYSVYSDVAMAVSRPSFGNIKPLTLLLRHISYMADDDQIFHDHKSAA
jgi:hypothetical protein